MSEVRVVMTTFGEDGEAQRIVKELISRRLIACANLLPRGTSFYEWEGKLCEDAEVVAFLKTTKDRYQELEVLLSELHPYDVPEIIAFPVMEGSAGYLDFVRKQTSRRSEG